MPRRRPAKTKTPAPRTPRPAPRPDAAADAAKQTIPSRRWKKIDLKLAERTPERYLNRELAWLDFNARVLEEALDATVPLLERVKFLAIFSSNLDEFFMVRVAGLKRQIDAGVEVPGPDGRKPALVLEELARRLHELVSIQHRAFERDVAPRLARFGVRVVAPEQLTGLQKDYLADYFQRTILPVMTPLAIDPAHPFPHLANKTICLAIGLRKREEDVLPASELALVHIPSSVLPRFIRLPSEPRTWHFVALEDAIRAHIAEVFAGYDVVTCNALRVTRDSDLVIDEESAGDLLKTIEESLRARRMGAAVRLQYDARLPMSVLAMLRDHLELKKIDLYAIRGLVAFSDLLQLYNEVDLPALKDPPLIPQRVPSLDRETTMFEAIRRRDALVHHPYQSFDYVVRFLEEAASDPAVLAIKMTLYRVGGASPIVEALRRAAHNGKQVGVLMELKARFEEQANIEWARKLEDAGAHVIYGVPGLKTHAKACLVVRKEAAGIRRYCHLSTGNYNARTSWLYCDMGIFSCRDDLCDEVSSLFNLITGYCRPPEFKHMSLAPTGLRERIVELIARERDHARKGRPARLVAKLNGLEDPVLIDALYEAAREGVQVELIVRGICCLRPGVPGLSERIRVIRIVDRFLEHARVVYVENDGDAEIFLSSADWMPRNLDRRIEVMFPVLDPLLRAEISHALALQLADDAKARTLGPDGENLRRERAGGVRSQTRLLQFAQSLARGGRPESGL